MSSLSWCVVCAELVWSTYGELEVSDNTIGMVTPANTQSTTMPSTTYTRKLLVSSLARTDSTFFVVVSNRLLQRALSQGSSWPRLQGASIKVIRNAGLVSRLSACLSSACLLSARQARLDSSRREKDDHDGCTKPFFAVKLTASQQNFRSIHGYGPGSIHRDC